MFCKEMKVKSVSFSPKYLKIIRYIVTKQIKIGQEGKLFRTPQLEIGYSFYYYYYYHPRGLSSSTCVCVCVCVCVRARARV
jgi:hypothetical protein